MAISFFSGSQSSFFIKYRRCPAGILQCHNQYSRRLTVVQRQFHKRIFYSISSLYRIFQKVPKERCFINRTHIIQITIPDIRSEHNSLFRTGFRTTEKNGIQNALTTKPYTPLHFRQLIHFCNIFLHSTTIFLAGEPFDSLQMMAHIMYQNPLPIILVL